MDVGILTVFLLHRVVISKISVLVDLMTPVAAGGFSNAVKYYSKNSLRSYFLRPVTGISVYNAAKQTHV